MLPFNFSLKKIFWNLVAICFVLMAVACFFGDNTQASRAKAVQVKDNVLDLVITGGETLFSFVSKARTQSAGVVDEVKAVVEE